MSYPIQPVVIAKDGVVRFETNPIVEYLLSLTDMNAIAIWCAENNIDSKYREQFAQLIGYSIYGYSMLSYVSDESYYAAVAEAEKLCLKEKINV